MVARYLGVVEAVGSNPATQTKKIRNILWDVSIFFTFVAGLEAARLSPNTTAWESNSTAQTKTGTSMLGAPVFLLGIFAVFRRDGRGKVSAGTGPISNRNRGQKLK